jgi:adenylosuccinate synthase
MWANREDGLHFSNGTCGRGIGKTYEREERMFSLTFGDIYHETVLKIKLESIWKNYYMFEESKHHDLFLERCKAIRYCGYILPTDGMELSATVFEGSQGLLLDQDIGFFPHVTRGNTGTKNIAKYEPEVYLVTRAYQTRHGRGPLTGTEIPHTIKLSEYEHNVKNEYQGEFRVSVLDLDVLKYAIEKDAYIRKSRKNLAITCLDNISDYKFILNGLLCTYSTEAEFIDAICKVLKIDGEVLLSRTPFTEKVEVR